MSVLPREAVKVVAEAFGYADLGDDASQVIANDLEYRLREITQEAIKFMRHSKRRRLATSDINNSLRLRNIEPMYGYSSVAQDAAGGRESGGDKLSKSFRKAAGSDVFYIPDRVVNLDDVIKGPLPKVPVEATFTSHWLAIEGVQPAIPQNPPVVAVEAVQQQIQSDKGKDIVDKVDVPALVMHALSAEQQKLYTNLRDGILQGPPPLRDAVLASVEKDPGLHQLLPHLITFAEETVTSNLKSLSTLNHILDFIDALRKNHNVFLDAYLHKLVPTLMTCAVTRHLGENLPGQPQDHWAVRNKAATIVTALCRKYANQYQELQKRICKTACQALCDGSKSFTTHYGAILLLTKLGPYVIEPFIVQNIPAYAKLWDKKMREAKDQVKAEGHKVKSALLDAVALYYRSKKAEVLGLESGGAGEAARVLLPPSNDESLQTSLEEFFGAQLKQVM